jgi:hypothetical protein
MTKTPSGMRRPYDDFAAALNPLFSLFTNNEFCGIIRVHRRSRPGRSCAHNASHHIVPLNLQGLSHKLQLWSTSQKTSFWQVLSEGQVNIPSIFVARWR